MKPKYVIIILCAFLLISSCSLFVGRKSDTTVVKFGNLFEVDNTDERRTLLNNAGALAAEGLYYAAWGIGTKEEYENSDGQTVDRYDAQIYLLFGEYKDRNTAAENMQSWLDAGRTNYEVFCEDEILFCGQTCTRLAYHFAGEEVLYDGGISIFGVLDNNAVCIELTFCESFADDPETAMNEFLDSCTYHAD